MNKLYTHQQLLTLGKLTQADFEVINQRRRLHNRLGFAYQLAFVRLFNRFPSQQPFEIEHELLTFVGVQLDIAVSHIDAYTERQPTLSEHQEHIRALLQLQRFGQAEQAQLQHYIFDEASRLEHTNTLMIKVKQFLKDQGILQPADDTLRRLIINQRQAARDHIFARISKSLSSHLHRRLDDLLVAGKRRRTPFQTLKQPPGQATPNAMLRLVSKLQQIEKTTVLSVDLSWLNNNYQRSLTHYAHRCSADRLRKLQADHRYAVLVCFLRQVYQDTIDYMVDMHDKLMLGVHNRAQNEIDEQTKKQRRMIRMSLAALRTLGRVILDESVDDDLLRSTLFEQIDRDELVSQLEAVEVWLDGKYSHVFNLVIQRFSYIRQFSPALLASLQFRAENNENGDLLEAIQLLHDLNEANKRKLPEDVPLDFVPKKLRDFVETSDGTVNKHAWECALLTVIRDELKAGNIFIQDSKRFGRFDDFFIADTKWQRRQDSFFTRAGLPANTKEVPEYLTERLNRAYDHFLKHLPDNTYAQVDEEGWHLSVDPAEKLNVEQKQRLDELQFWLSDKLRSIKLPELLIEVDNDLHFTHHFMTPTQQQTRQAEDVCTLIATIMAHGCNIGPYTMARLTQDINYNQIKHMTDWQLTEEAQRVVLAQLVNGISRLDIRTSGGI